MQIHVSWTLIFSNSQNSTKKIFSSIYVFKPSIWSKHIFLVVINSLLKVVFFKELIDMQNIFQFVSEFRL